MLDSKDDKVMLSFAFGETIHRFTTKKPMVIEDILEALCFTAGHALSQKAAKQFSTEKVLRERCIRALERGITEGNRGDQPKVILPSDKGVIIN